MLYSQILLTPLIFSQSSFYPFTIPKLTFFRITSALIGLILIFQLLKGTLILAPKRLASRLPLFLFLLSPVLSTLFSIDPTLSFFGQPGNGIGLLTIFALFITISSIPIFFPAKHLPNLYKSISLSGTLAVIFSVIESLNLLPLASSWQTEPFSRLFFPIGQASHFGAFLALTLIFTCFTFPPASKKKFLDYLIPASSFCLQFAALVLTGSRSALIALLISTLIFTALHLKNHLKKLSQKTKQLTFKKLLLPLLLLTITIIISIPNLSGLPLVSRTTSQLISLDTNGRSSWIKSALDMAASSPILGNGLATFRHQFNLYRNRDFLTYAEGNSQVITPEFAHSKPFDLLAAQGILGLITFYLFIIWLIWSINKPQKLTSKISTHNFQQLSAPLIFSLLTFSIQQLFSFEVIPIILLFYITSGAALSLISLTEKLHKSSTSSPLSLRSIAFSIIAIPSLSLLIAYSWSQFHSDALRTQSLKQSSTNLEQSILNFTTATVIFPYDYELYQQFATIYFNAAEKYPDQSVNYLTQSYKLWQQSLILNPNSPSNYFNQGLTCYKLYAITKNTHLIPHCLDAFSQSIKTSPNNPLYAKTSSKYLTNLNRPDLALEAINQALSLTPSDLDAQQAKSILEQQLNSAKEK